MGSGREYTLPEDDMRQLMAEQEQHEADIERAEKLEREAQQAKDYAEMEVNALLSSVAIDAVNGRSLDDIADEVERLRVGGI